MDLFNFASKFVVLEELVGIVDNGGDGGGRLGSRGESGSDRIATYAFGEACRPSLWLERVRERSRGGSEVRSGDHFE